MDLLMDAKNTNGKQQRKADRQQAEEALQASRVLMRGSFQRLRAASIGRGLFQKAEGNG